MLSSNFLGAVESILPVGPDTNFFHGENGLGDIDIWHPNKCPAMNKITHPKSAFQAIRDLVIKVKSFY